MKKDKINKKLSNSGQFKQGMIPWNKGKKMSKKFCENLSKANSGKNHPNWGKHLSKETRMKISKANVNKKKSEKTKQKISKAKKGQRNSIKTEFKKGQYWRQYRTKESYRLMGLKMKGRKLSEETKEKIRKFNIGKKLSDKTKKKISKYNKAVGRRPPVMRKEKHPNWQGGISFEPYSPEFNLQLKRKIKKRDNFTCQECGKSEKELKQKLCIHHIDYDKKNNNKNNLVSLCRSCHTKTNFKRKDWTKYFNNKINEKF